MKFHFRVGYPGVGRVVVHFLNMFDFDAKSPKPILSEAQKMSVNLFILLRSCLSQ